MTHKLNEVDLNDVNLLERGLNCEELVGKKVIVKGYEIKTGNNGDYLSIEIENSVKNWITGAHNIMAKLIAADKQGLLPLECKVKKIGNAFDIE